MDQALDVRVVTGRMTSSSDHFSAIGFGVDSIESLLDLLARDSVPSERIESEAGTHICHRSSCGAEIWLHVNSSRELEGIDPSFDANTAVTVALTDVISQPNESALEGAIEGLVNPTYSEGSMSGDYPIVFSCPDLQGYEPFDVGMRARASITAFAHRLTVYGSADELMNAPADVAGLSLATQAFVPIGSFVDQLDPAACATPIAEISGIVRDSAMRRNEITGQIFFWAQIESLGAAFTVVADARLEAHEAPVGGVIVGEFWLTGRLKSIEPYELASRLREEFAQER